MGTKLELPTALVSAQASTFLQKPRGVNGRLCCILAHLRVLACRFRVLQRRTRAHSAVDDDGHPVRDGAGNLRCLCRQGVVTSLDWWHEHRPVSLLGVPLDYVTFVTSFGILCEQVLLVLQKIVRSSGGVDGRR